MLCCDHSARVTVGGQLSAASVASLSYRTALITNISSAALSTDGGTLVTLSGSDFGPEDTNVTATYSNGVFSAAALSCVVSQNHTQATCISGPGVGASQSWRLSVEGQLSTLSVDTTSYLPPTVSTLSGALLLDTRGGQLVTVSGTQFGPTGTSSSAVYGAGAYTASCSSASSTLLVCTSVAGVGRLHS